MDIHGCLSFPSCWSLPPLPGVAAAAGEVLMGAVQPCALEVSLTSVKLLTSLPLPLPFIPHISGFAAAAGGGRAGHRGAEQPRRLHLCPSHALLDVCGRRLLPCLGIPVGARAAGPRWAPAQP